MVFLWLTEGLEARIFSLRGPTLSSRLSRWRSEGMEPRKKYLRLLRGHCGTLPKRSPQPIAGLFGHLLANK